jgi:hypothetical protein
MAKNNGEIESRNRFIGVLDVQPPAFDRCQITGSHTIDFLPFSNPLIMPGIHLPGKRFYTAVNQKDRAVDPAMLRNLRGLEFTQRVALSGAGFSLWVFATLDLGAQHSQAAT